MYSRENKAKYCFFPKNDKIDKPLSRQKQRKYKSLVSRMEGDITTDPVDTEKI